MLTLTISSTSTRYFQAGRLPQDLTLQVGRVGSWVYVECFYRDRRWMGDLQDLQDRYRLLQRFKGPIVVSC